MWLPTHRSCYHQQIQWINPLISSFLGSALLTPDTHSKGWMCLARLSLPRKQPWDDQVQIIHHNRFDLFGNFKLIWTSHCHQLEKPLGKRECIYIRRDRTEEGTNLSPSLWHRKVNCERRLQALCRWALFLVPASSLCWVAFINNNSQTQTPLDSNTRSPWVDESGCTGNGASWNSQPEQDRTVNIIPYTSWSALFWWARACRIHEVLPSLHHAMHIQGDTSRHCMQDHPFQSEGHLNLAQPYSIVSSSAPAPCSSYDKPPTGDQRRPGYWLRRRTACKQIRIIPLMSSFWWPDLTCKQTLERLYHWATGPLYHYLVVTLVSMHRVIDSKINSRNSVI